VVEELSEDGRKGHPYQATDRRSRSRGGPEREAFQVIGDLMELNIFASINKASIPKSPPRCAPSTVTSSRRQRDKPSNCTRSRRNSRTATAQAGRKEEDEQELRAPIVTFMGHVDHGKTTLMDAIRKTRVAAGEAANHAAHRRVFGPLQGSSDHLPRYAGPRCIHRDAARGATVTDIVVLVVAAMTASCRRPSRR